MANNNRRVCRSVREASRIEAEIANISSEEMLEAMVREFCERNLSSKERFEEANLEASQEIARMVRKGAL
jgi:hypothetical protein